MPPQLTEAWGTVYAHILTILLVFALGVPALTYELTVPEDMRRIVHRNMRWTQAMLIPVVGLGLCILAFVWVLHPCVTLPEEWTWWVAAALISAAVAGTVLVWGGTFGRSRREAVVERLESNLVNAIDARGQVPELLLVDLLYLGQRGEAGKEKEMVLMALERLATRVLKRSDYEGSELRDLISGIADVIGCGREYALGGNLETARRILSVIWETCTNSGGRLALEVDTVAARDQLESVGMLALETGAWATSIQILQSRACDCVMLRRVGVRALERRRANVAVAALSRLESAIMGTAVEPRDEMLANLLGMEAMIARTGPSGRERVEAFYGAHPGFQVTAVEYESAVRYFRDELDYEMADVLRSWSRH